MRRAALIALLTTATGCGGGTTTRPSPQPAPIQVTESYSGTTVQTGASSCTGDSHNITVAEGELSVRLVATSDPAGALSVQVCAGGVDDGNCSIRQQRIAVGQTVTGTRRGQALHNLKLLPHNCVFGGAPLGAPVTYTVSITYMK